MDNELRKFRTKHNIPVSDIVETVKEIYPKYDRTLQSKCEHSDEYGVELSRQAMEHLYDRFAWQGETAETENEKKE